MRAWDIRPATADDVAYVMASWINGYRGRGFARKADVDRYHEGQRAVAARLLGSGDTWIACDPEDHSVIWGWCCEGRGVLHWVTVKGIFQGHGIARALIDHCDLSSGPLVVSHWTPALCRRFSGRKIVYDPYELMRTI